MSLDVQSRPRPRPRLPWMGWVGRVALALVFAFGMLVSVRGGLDQGEHELGAEVDEDGEITAREQSEASVVQRSSLDGGCRVEDVVWPRVPQRLASTAPEPARACWSVPRRAPPDEDEPSIG